jgi:hypothetical protein
MMGDTLKLYFAEALYESPKTYEPETSWQVYKAYDVQSVLSAQRATIQQLEARVKELGGIIAECVRLVRCGQPHDVERYALDPAPDSC